MPLTRSPHDPRVDQNGDVQFAMLDPLGNVVPCEAALDYLIAVPATDEHKAPLAIFGELRDLIETTASEQFDLHGVDERGVVRLAPLVF